MPWSAGLSASETPKAMPAGASSPSRPPKPDRSKGRGPTKRDPPVLQFRGLGTGITTLSRKTPMLRKRQKKSRPTCHTA